MRPSSNQGDWSSDPVTPAVGRRRALPDKHVPGAQGGRLKRSRLRSPRANPSSSRSAALAAPRWTMRWRRPRPDSPPRRPRRSPARRRGWTSDEDDFGAETEFVDPRQLRASMGAAAAAGRAASTRSTIDAARAAITAPPEPEPAAASGLRPEARRQVQAAGAAGPTGGARRLHRQEDLPSLGHGRRPDRGRLWLSVA